MHYLEAEASVTLLLIPPRKFWAPYDIKPDDRFIWIPFGVRGILPLRAGRMEISAGGGGLIDNYSLSNPKSSVDRVPYWGVGGELSYRF